MQDRDPSAFLSIICPALTIDGNHPDELPPDQRHEIRDDISLDDILLSLELAGQPLVMIIDEFERINEPSVTAIVKTLIDVAPASLHLVISSRTFPAIPLSALEVAGEVQRVDTHQLKLERGELAWML